ncbi:hypothetical protein [Vreelandella sp. H-I2]
MHQLLTHPLFEEREPWEILQPFGFESNVHSTELPDEVENPEEFAQFAQDAKAYIKGLDHTPPPGFSEIARFETEDADIVFVSVRPKTLFAMSLLCADPLYRSANNICNPAYIAVYQERMRQLSVEGFIREDDDQHEPGTLAVAGTSYAINAADALQAESPESGKDAPAAVWPFHKQWWKPSPDPRRNLIKAGALILAEIERLDRTAAKAKGKAGEDAA